MMYTQAQMYREFLSGVLCTVFFLSLVWHGRESDCQIEHNISDCMAVFIPTPEEEIE